MAVIKAGCYHTSHGQDPCAKKHLIQIQHITIGCRAEVKMEHASKEGGGCSFWDLEAIPGTISQTGHGNLVQYCGDGELEKESPGENVAIPR